MASTCPIQALCGSWVSTQAHTAGGKCGPRRARRSCSLSCSVWGPLRRDHGIEHMRGGGPRSTVVQAAGSKQKKKAKDKKKSTSLGDKQWKFDELMLVWDDVFVKVGDDAARATTLYELSRSGFAQHGAGCVLMEEAVTTRPSGAASGFTFKSRYSSASAPELPSYTCAEWKASYVPREFIADPTKAPASSADLPAAPGQMEAGGVPLVEQGKLLSVLRGMDKTRLQGLLSEPGSQDSVDAGTRDVGGEAPCDMAKDELVVMLMVLVDGQPAVGADVLKALHTGQSWTLKLRDDLPL